MWSVGFLESQSIGRYSFVLQERLQESIRRSSISVEMDMLTYSKVRIWWSWFGLIVLDYRIANLSNVAFLLS